MEGVGLPKKGMASSFNGCENGTYIRTEGRPLDLPIGKQLMTLGIPVLKELGGAYSAGKGQKFSGG